MAYDPIAAVNSGIYTVAPNLGLGELQRRWNVEEDVTTLYAKANFMAEIAGKPVTGNLGVQYVMTDQTSTGITIDAPQLPRRRPPVFIRKPRFRMTIQICCQA